MNLSTISVYDNVNPPESPSKSFEYRIINDLLAVNTETEVRIYCPLCTKCFHFEVSLFEHLKGAHGHFLIRARYQTLEFKECAFCNAKFYGRHLTVKHALLHHGKVIRGVFVQRNKCFFCDVKLNKKDYGSVAKHIEDAHFLDFEEEFGRMFSCDNTVEMSLVDLINSSVSGERSVNFEDICVDVRNGSLDSNVQDFDDASKMNCFDFTDLKEQLDNMKCKQQAVTNSGKKSILKDTTNATGQKSVRRVLRFDLPTEDDDKENSVLIQNLKNFKQITIDEHSLLCEESKMDKYLKLNETFPEKPQHSSTPNKTTKREPCQPVKCKSNFISYITDRKLNEYEFQCGRCRAVFKENVDLVCHVKKNHKLFNLHNLQPCYRCAICSARFYKNYYLRKHHNLHKPY